MFVLLVWPLYALFLSHEERAWNKLLLTQKQVLFIRSHTHRQTHTPICIQSHLSSSMSLCTCKAVRRPSLQRPSKISQVQTKPPAEPDLLSTEAISAQRTNIHLSSQEACLTGEIYLPHINEKRTLSFLIRPLGYHLSRGAAAIFNHSVLPHTKLVAFDGCCIIIWILIKALYINLGPVIVNFQ